MEAQKNPNACIEKLNYDLTEIYFPLHIIQINFEVFTWRNRFQRAGG